MKDVDPHGRIAIIGMSCRMPGASTPDAFWRNLVAGVESVRTLDDGELLRRGVPPSELDDPHYVKVSRSLENVEQFDAAFFGMPPREARYMDPQQRIFLECCHEAFEDAGYVPADVGAGVGVFAGSAISTYMLNYVLGSSDDPNLNRQMYESAYGNDKDYLTSNVSYRLNLRGPSMSINSACATALLSVVQACKALLAYDCDMALAGGVRIELPADRGYLYREGGILSPVGRCFAFDERAAGTVFGDGAGAFLLKRLEDALADEDHIHAVLAGFAVSNDGAGKAGLLAPSVSGQEQALREALDFAGFNPRSIGYLEAHGTGTAVGDPIEFRALQRVFPDAGDGAPYCALGSVKANVGHLNTAAGVAGLMKAALVLRHKRMPPQINFERPNPEIPLANGPFYVPTTARPWPEGAAPRRAGVSCFGIGGTNVHVVLEEAPARPAGGAAGPHLLVLSARSASALERQRARLLDHLIEHPELELGDVAFTLQDGRRAFPFRHALVCRDRDDLAHAFAQPLQAAAAEAAPRAVFMFPGQGTQFAGMGSELHARQPVFRAALDRCLAVLERHPNGAAVRALLLGGPDASDAAVVSTAVAQPALFALEYALCELWMSFGIRAASMIGHSLGEYVAACVAGVMALDDALALVALRGELMAGMAPGAMLSVALDARALKRYLAGGCELAASNAPGRSVAAGPVDAIAGLQARLEEEGVDCKRLHTSHAFHCALVEPVLPAMRAALERVRLAPPRIPYLSNVTGTWISAAQATSVDYWLQHMRAPVRFAEGLETLLEAQPDSVLIEAGPGTTLTQLARRQPRHARAVLAALPDRQGGTGQVSLLTAVGKAWQAGLTVDWPALRQGRGGHRVPLPTYAFERQRYWLDERAPAPIPAAPTRRPLDEWTTLPAWLSSHPPLPAQPRAAARRILLFGLSADHVLAQALAARGHTVKLVLPGTAYEQDGAVHRVRPRERADFERLAQALHGAGWRPQQVVYAWGADAGHAAATDAVDLDLNLLALLPLAQALVAGFGDVQGDVRILVAHAFAFGDGARPLPAGAMLAGAARVFANEIPGHACQCIDSDYLNDGAARDLLLRELDLPVEHTVLALRHGQRWREYDEPVRLAAPPGGQARLPAGGTYLITGGLGGLGKTVARWLAGRGPARLVLVGRRGRDGAEALVRELEASGAETMTIGADVACLDELEQAVAAAEARFGRLDGVFHLAGQPSSGSIAAKSPAMAAGTIAPKVAGTCNLHAVLRARRPGFVMLFSSIAALVGAPGRFEYAAANAFLDAFAVGADEPAGCRWIAVNWDTWRDAGMAVDAAVPAYLQEHKRRELAEGIGTDEGVQILERLFGAGLPVRIAVSTRPLAARRDAARAPDLPGESAVGAAPRPAAASAAQSTADVIAALWSRFLGHDTIAEGDNFFELGGDSLLATRVVSAVNAELSVRITVRDLLETSNLGELAQFVDALGKNQAAANDEALQVQVW